MLIIYLIIYLFYLSGEYWKLSYKTVHTQCDKDYSKVSYQRGQVGR